MAKEKRRLLILFLETFKQELLAMAENMKDKVLRRSDLDNILAFSVASKEDKEVVHLMVNEVVSEKDDKRDTGHRSFASKDTEQQPYNNDGKSVGHAKTYTTGHFRSDKDAA